MSDLESRLAEIVRGMPRGSSVTLPVEWLKSQLGTVGEISDLTAKTA